MIRVWNYNSFVVAGIYRVSLHWLNSDDGWLIAQQNLAIRFLRFGRYRSLIAVGASLTTEIGRRAAGFLLITADSCSSYSS